MSKEPWKISVNCLICGNNFFAKKEDIEASFFDEHFYVKCPECGKMNTIHARMLPLDVIEDADLRFKG